MSPTRNQSSTTTTRARAAAAPPAPRAGSQGDYVVPVVGAKVPPRVVEMGFWTGLAGAAALGAVDPPLALLVGAGVIVARHRHR